MALSTARRPPGIIGALLLGAGVSRRFGSDKRLHVLDGQTVAETTVAAYTQAFADITVVVRDNDDALMEKLAPLAVDTLVATDAHLGMGHSLAAGIAGLNWRWAFVGLLDMPFIKAATLLQLKDVAAARNRPGIICPTLRGAESSRFGHPVGWHRHYFDELGASTGDEGGRHILARHADEIITVAVDDEGIYRDIDVPADLA